jgi:hypothetical protein
MSHGVKSVITGTLLGNEPLAESVVRDLAVFGYVIVPSEPTQDMSIAGLEALCAQISEFNARVRKAVGDGLSHDHRIAMIGAIVRSSAETDACWRAMVAAGQRT